MLLVLKIILPKPVAHADVVTTFPTNLAAIYISPETSACIDRVADGLEPCFSHTSGANYGCGASVPAPVILRF